ncbi:MAG: hypothetical protein NTV86_19460 [Planctomycetota bacterium]|nr:hypothetical protein [Planctomycetota bacterium]
MDVTSVNDPTRQKIELVFRVSGKAPEPGYESQIWRTDGGGHWWAGRRSKAGQFLPDLKIMGISVPADMQTLSLDLRAAAGPWQSETSDGLQAKGRLSAAKDAPNYTEQSALITARVDTEKEDTQVVAIDRDGIRHVSRPVDTRGTDDVAEADFVFPRLTPANIKSFTLETRPYEMIHLKDISLVPGRYADAEVTSGPPQSQPSATRIPALIGQLGSPSAKEREEAQKALVEIGEPALEALKAAAADKDVERAARAKQAIETIHDEMRLDAILADVGSVHVDLQYYASNTAGSPYWRLTFVSNSGPPYVGPGSGPWKVARMPAEQLTRLLKHLRAAGFFQRAVGWEALDISSRQPCYVIRVMHGQSQYYESLGWGLPMLQRLEALRKHLDGDPANAMDKLLTALEPKRHEWSPPARSTPSGPTTQPAAGRIPALIGQLGSASAKEREEAQMALVEIGPEAVKPLRKVAAGADVEAALRAKAALTGIGRKAIGQPYDAWAAYTAATDFLLKNGSRVEAADRFMTVAEMEPDDRNAWCREMSAELGPMLEQMAREDAAFRESPDAKGLRGRQRLDYLVFKLRDVAERELMEPGRCQVLFSKRDNAAWALRTLGKEAVPTLIELLDDRRPTRSSGGALNGGYVLRYADVSLQILEAIAARNFDRQSSGRGTCLTNPGDKAQAMIREVKDWWQRNKDKAESQWVREALAENGIGAMWDSLQWAERLIELEGPACADFFRERMKAEPGNDHIPRFLREALASPPSTGSGQSGSPQTQPAAAQVPALIEQLGSASAKEREEAQKALVEIGEPGLEALKAAAEDKDAERAMRAKQAAAEITERMRPASRVGLFLMDVPIGVEDAERAPLAKLRLAKAPILCAEDIAEYGWDNHVIYLTAAGLRRLPDMRQGSLPFVMVADGQRCYLGQFYSPLSSYPASVPTIALELGAPRNPIRIHIPIAGANDPRGDPRIQKALRELGKLKSPATNPATQPAAGRIPALIGQLASASAKEREEAQKALVEIGPEAVAPLKAATQDKDLERSGRAVTALREMEDSLWSTAWCRAPGAGARDRIKLSLLPEDQRQEEGRWAILAETTKQSVEKLAEDTSLPLGAQTDPPIDPLELTLANFRVQKLVGRARRSEQVRREVVAAALSIIREYVGRPDPSQVLGRDSFTKGWRSGYDCLLAVLTLTDEKGDGLQAAMNAFARHQAEIGRPLDKVTPQYGRWPVGGYGHNEYFFMYLDQALVAYAQHGNLPEQANAILQRYVADRQKDRKANYVCAEKKLVVAYPYGLGNTFGTAMELQKVMLESGAWKEPRPSPDTVRPGSPQTQPAAGRIPALIGTRAAPARAGEP